MAIVYKETKNFSAREVEELFLSVGWISGKYPSRLAKALNASSLVVSAWDGEKLVGLVRGLDDGEMVAFLHYLLVRPDYQGRGIAAELLARAKEKYRNFLYIDIMPDEKKNVPFYEKHGFSVLENATAMQIKHR